MENHREDWDQFAELFAQHRFCAPCSQDEHVDDDAFGDDADADGASRMSGAHGENGGGGATWHGHDGGDTFRQPQLQEQQDKGRLPALRHPVWTNWV